MASVWKRKADRKDKNRAWRISYTDENGRRRTVAGSKDRAVAEQIGNKLEGDVALRKRGIIDATTERYSIQERRPLTEHLADWESSLTSKGSTDKHVRTSRARTARVLELAKITRISHLTPSAAQRGIQTIRDGGASLETVNHYLRSLKGFSRWLWRDGRARQDAIAHLSSFNVRTDRRHDRRDLTADEVARLLSAAEYGPPVLGMDGPDRAMVYRTALGTGFRAAELRSLTPESFHLGGDPPTVTVEAAYSKHRRQDDQPIRRDLADRLRGWLTDKPAGGLVFGTLPDKTARMMRADLEAAGIVYRDEMGRVADFHALRHTFISGLTRNGVHPKNAQTLARHSTITLTMDRYSHLGLGDLATDLEALPSTEPVRQVARATGTDDLTAQHHAQRPGVLACRTVSPGGTTNGTKAADGNPRNLLSVQGLDTGSRCVAHSDADLGGVAQLAEQRPFNLPPANTSIARNCSADNEIGAPGMGGDGGRAAQAQHPANNDPVQAALNALRGLSLDQLAEVRDTMDQAATDGVTPSA